MNIIKSHRELNVYMLAFASSMKIFNFSRNFPKEETYSLTDQIRRSSRSVCNNIAEGFRRRKYPKAFANKLNESEAEAAETQNWLDFAFSCGYLDEDSYHFLDKEYDIIIGMLVNMQRNSDKWSL
ncbi:MAG: four helix bundle protein [Mariniphaga sp.]